MVALCHSNATHLPAWECFSSKAARAVMARSDMRAQTVKTESESAIKTHILPVDDGF